MSKSDSQNTEMIQRLQSMQKEWSLISTLNKSLATILDEIDFQTVFTQSLKAEFHFNDFLLLRKSNVDIETFLTSLNINVKTHKSSCDAYFEKCMNSAEPLFMDLKELTDNSSTPSYFSNAKKAGMRIVVGFCLPSILNDQNVLYLFYKNYITANDFPERILLGIGTQISITIRNILIGKQMKKRPNLVHEKIQEPVDEKKKEEGFQGIIGESDEIKDIFDQILQVAPSSSNVLIDGETGTGKELIAQAIHNLSSASKKEMIKINCASIPKHLVESELFGHEKGSFTGATELRIGKFEQAQNSTIFLDEIGELPLELQGRLLRVLQEKEIQRIGSNKSIKVNARVIAATNRNLQEEVANGNFRSDLFYRLNVFPIHLPALRDRKSDIPLLANYFLQEHAVKYNKKIKGFSQKIMNKLCENSWLGNIRELENLIERSIITTKDELIKEMDFPKITDLKKPVEDLEIKTLHQMEKEYILKVVEKCNGKISGESGAAKLLGLPATTLISKMQKLGIKKNYLFKKSE
ncbi:sigma-54 interaction domain-containing protein [Chryseobacterium sp. MMS23-Vi53]|uniref:sigma-54 interaction domain-containing protein n=1 Tax=Chryseobacterium sp. MMS23-Vi53 TaxID=3386644 RepID=UPI0039E9891D